MPVRPEKAPRRKETRKTGMAVTKLFALHANAITKFSYKRDQLCPKQNGATVQKLIE